jgi:hypothetical protein
MQADSHQSATTTLVLSSANDSHYMRGEQWQPISKSFLRVLLKGTLGIIHSTTTRVMKIQRQTTTPQANSIFNIEILLTQNAQASTTRLNLNFQRSIL